jgi:hypothetical protein
MKIYNVNRKSDDEYIAGLDSSWETIDLAYQAADLQNKYYSDILHAEVYEMELKGPDDWKEYERNIIDSKYKSPKKPRIKQPSKVAEKVL